MCDMAGSLSRGASEESQAKNHVAAFVAAGCVLPARQAAADPDDVPLMQF